MDLTQRKCLKRELGLTGEIEVDIERFGKNGRKISQSHQRNQTIANLELIFVDILLPMCDNVSDGLMVLALYSRASHRMFCYWTLGLLYLPTIFLITHYVLNFTKRRWWYFELIFVVLFGPALDWIVNLYKLLKKEKIADVDKELQKFLYITKTVNGVIEASLQLIWTVLLISVQVNPLPWADITHIPDLLGNSVPFPASTVSLVFSLLSIIKNLAYFWNKFGTVKTEGSLPGNSRGRCCILPILVTSLLFRLGCLIMFSVYLNIYTLALLGLNLVAYNGIRLFSPCFENNSELGEAVSGFANSLLPTPSSTDQRSHNLYLLHDLVTSSLNLCFLVIIQILNLDYNQPFYTRPGNLIIGHTEFLVIITSVIITISINCLFRFILYLINRNVENDDTNKRSKLRKMKIKVTKVLMSKAVSALVMVFLMASSLALVAVSAIITKHNVEDNSNSMDILSSNCQLKYTPGIDFLVIDSITCNSVQNFNVIFFPSHNLLNDSQCYSNIRNEDLSDNLHSEDDIDLMKDVENGRFDQDSILSRSFHTPNHSPIPFGFGKVGNIVFISIMICIALLLTVVLVFYRKPTKPVKPQVPKIPLHSTKPKHLENLKQENLDETRKT